MKISTKSLHVEEELRLQTNSYQRVWNLCLFGVGVLKIAPENSMVFWESREKICLEEMHVGGRGGIQNVLNELVMVILGIWVSVPKKMPKREKYGCGISAFGELGKIMNPLIAWLVWEKCDFIHATLKK